MVERVKNKKGFRESSEESENALVLRKLNPRAFSMFLELTEPGLSKEDFIRLAEAHKGELIGRLVRELMVLQLSGDRLVQMAAGYLEELQSHQSFPGVSSLYGHVYQPMRGLMPDGYYGRIVRILFNARTGDASLSYDVETDRNRLPLNKGSSEGCSVEGFL